MKLTIRAFVAVELGEIAARADQLVRRLARIESGVRWNAKQLHLTLKFLGEIPLVESAEICRAVKRAAARHDPFELRMRGVGAFPNLDRPRTIWLGVVEGLEPLQALQQEIETELADLGYPVEGRPFTPHITVGRLKGGGGRGLRQLMDTLRAEAEYDFGEAAVDEVTVFSSELLPEGPEYDPLCHVPLGDQPERTEDDDWDDDEP